MAELQHYIAIIGALQGFVLFVLLITDRRVSQASRLVGMICLVLAVMFCTSLALTSNPQGRINAAIGVLFYLPATLGGLIYLYCRNALLDQQVTPKDVIHAAPLLICYVLVADILVWEAEALIAWVLGQPTDSWRIIVSEYVLIGHGLIYLPATLWLIVKLRERARLQLAGFNPAVFQWLLLLTAALLIAWVLKTIFALTEVSHPYAFSFAADVLLVIIIYCVAIAQWRHPQLFTVDQLNAIPSPSPPTPASNPLLEPSTRAELYRSVQSTVESDQLFQDSSLTLTKLAQTVGMSNNHLSEVLNQHGGKNFYEFINHYRIDFIRQQLLESSDRKILDIAMEAGFASKSTFNAIFKQHTGKTPTQYRRELSQSV